MEPGLHKVILSEEEIKKGVSRLAKEISRDYEGKEILLVGILKGAFIFLADLARLVTVPVQLDFIAVSSYGSATKTSGVVRIMKDLDTDIRGRHVLIVEDIVDTGLTLNYLTRNLFARGPASLEVCTLLDKEIPDKVKVSIKYVGFKVPDIFVVGYGLDWAENYRNLPYIAALSEERQK